jgi:hypothetical protein
MTAGTRRTFLLLILLAVIPSPHSAHAQYFGQNKVQYESYDWSIIKTPHYRVYFHDRERGVALDVARMAERAYDRLSTILNHEIADPIPIILYASQSEFQQTNVSSGPISEGTGGLTEYLKRRVTLPATGSYGELDHVLTHELVHAFQLDLLTRGSQSSLGGAFHYVPPTWVMEGMAEYLSLRRVDELTAMWLRDGALQNYLVPVAMMDRIADIRVYRYGQAIMAYLGETYGDEKIGQLFKKAAAVRSLPRAFEETLGLTMDKFSENWMEAMRKKYLPEIQDHENPEDFAFRLTNSEKELANINLAPAVSADGDHVVFFSDRSLYDDLYLASAIDGTVEKRLVKGERSSDFESLRYFRSTADWSPDGERICFVALSGGHDVIDILRVGDEKILAQLRFDLDGIVSPSFSPDGEWITFSGLADGSSNLYRVRADGTGFEQLTDDRYMVREPRYTPDGQRIVFVTDRGPDTDFDQLLFSPSRFAFFDLRTRAVTMPEGQAGINISPHLFPDNRHLLYISNRSGIANLYIRDLETGEDRRITNILTGVTGILDTGSAVSLSRNGKRLVFSAFSKGSWDLFAIKDPLSLWEHGVPWRMPEPLIAVTTVPAGGRPARVTLRDDRVLGPPISSAAGGGAAASAPSDSVASPQGEAGAPIPVPGAAGAEPAAASTDGSDAAGLRAPSIGLASLGPTLVTDESAGGPGTATGPEHPRASASGGGPPDSTGTAGATGEQKPSAAGPGGSEAAQPAGDTAVEAQLDSLWAEVHEMNGPKGEKLEGQAAAREHRKGGSEAEEEPSIDIAEVFAEKTELMDPASFEVKKYKPKFSADYLSANGFFASNVGLAAQSVLQFSDVLGNQVILVGADVYGSLNDSNLLLEYINLKNRTNWGLSAFQFRNDFFIFTAQEGDFVSQIYRGVDLTLQRPFSRFRRAEFSLQGLAVSQEVYAESFNQGSISGYDPVQHGILYYVQPGVALVEDNTLYGYTGPISGGRDRFGFDIAVGDLRFRTYLGDVRRYLNIRHRYALAVRLVGAVSEGRDPQFFRIGGPYTVRGYDYGQFGGWKVAMTNLEFRFPLIEQLRLGWPLPLSLQGVRGALFFDAGAAWRDNRKFKPIESHGGAFRLRDVAASYGLSTSINLGFSVVKWDLAWPTDLSRNLGKPRGSISFGLDY